MFQVVMKKNTQNKPTNSTKSIDLKPKKEKATEKPVEVNGPKGPEPTRYGDWERNGRCFDF